MLACGGYESNPDLVRAYEGLPGWQSMFPPTIEGDGIVMAAEIGAQVRVIHNNMALFLGFNLPGRQPGELPLFRLVGISEMLCPHTIVVNKAGHRFADEFYFQSMVPSLRAYSVESHRHVNLPCYLVFDQQYADGFSFAGNPKGCPIPQWVARAATIEQLAQSLGIDAPGLARDHHALQHVCPQRRRCGLRARPRHLVARAKGPMEADARGRNLCVSGPGNAAYSPILWCRTASERIRVRRTPD